MLLVPQRGIVHVTGEGWVGKTTFGLTASDNPEKIAIIDCEQSAKQYHESVGFGLYVDLLAETRSFSPGPATFYALRDIVDTMGPDQYEVLLVENIAVIEAAIEAEVEESPEKYGLSPGQLERMAALKWRPIKDIYRRLMSVMATKANIVIATSHLKSVWVGKQVIPGLMRPQGKDTLEEVCFLKIWLLRQPGWPPPAGLVLKSRIGKLSYGKGSASIQNVLPNRLPVATWDAIAKYLKAPFDPDNPKPGEVPSDEEIHMMRGTLSPKHMEILTLAAQTGGDLIGKADESDNGASSPAKREEKPKPSASVTKLPTDLTSFLLLLGKKKITIPDACQQLGIAKPTDIEDYGKAAETLGVL